MCNRLVCVNGAPDRLLSLYENPRKCFLLPEDIMRRGFHVKLQALATIFSWQMQNPQLPALSCTNYTGYVIWNGVWTCYVICTHYERTAFLAWKPLAKSCYHGNQRSKAMWRKYISCPVKSSLENGRQAELSCQGYRVYRACQLEWPSLCWSNKISFWQK